MRLDPRSPKPPFKFIQPGDKGFCQPKNAWQNPFCHSAILLTPQKVLPPALCTRPHIIGFSHQLLCHYRHRPQLLLTLLVFFVVLVTINCSHVQFLCAVLCTVCDPAVVLALLRCTITSWSLQSLNEPTLAHIKYRHQLVPRTCPLHTIPSTFPGR